MAGNRHKGDCCGWQGTHRAGMSPKCAAALTGLAVLAFFSIAMNMTQHGWVNWYRMAKTGQVTTATVTQVHPENHRSCTFQYIVAGKTYQASDSGCDAATGQSIQIRYLPSDPTFATTRDPAGELNLQVFAAVFMSMFAAVVTWFCASKKPLARIKKTDMN
jgi:hypothetical protein